MIELELKVDVQCQQPNWVFASENTHYLYPSYRLFVDADLLTERTWAYSADSLIEETIWLCVHPDGEYTVKLEPVLMNPAQAEFSLLNFRVTNKNYMSNRVNNREVTFRLQ